MTEQLYQYTVLRYVHDPITQEFINIGVVLYSKEARFLKCIVNNRYSRLSDTFQDVNGQFYRTAVGAIERTVNTLRVEWSRGNWTNQPPSSLVDILPQILPADDSSLVFGGVGGGLCADLQSELSRLYARLVTRYADQEDQPRRDDEQVWQVYQQELMRRQILDQLQPARIVTSTFEMSFDHAWKNDLWHPVEAISFDLMKATSIANKASRWIGHALSLSKSSELGSIYFLLGAPQQPDLRRAYENAIANMSENIPKAFIVREEDAAAFSERLAHLIKQHAADTGAPSK